jgi:hypothetical protein
VFEEKKHIADAAFFAEFDKPLLQAQARGVVNRSELKYGNHVL